ncbi:hypothetical protein K474DRAFT_1699557 [Panus rudis PR-1116 ss-1]|nr:hypothetical protein K474DRAFT_1699557 [Panus rudis PR-1116 ss-1]
MWRPAKFDLYSLRLDNLVKALLTDCLKLCLNLSSSFVQCGGRRINTAITSTQRPGCISSVLFTTSFPRSIKPINHICIRSFTGKVIMVESSSTRVDHHVQRLNFDTLLHVMEFLPQSGEWQLMRTCRSLYLGGCPHFTRHVRLQLEESNGQKVASFCDFLEVDEYARCRYMRSLCISVEGFQRYVDLAPLLPRLACVLRKCTSLARLSLHGLSYWFHALVPEVFEAISTLPSLRHIDTYEKDNDLRPALIVLQRLSPSSLVSLSLRNGGTEWDLNYGAIVPYDMESLPKEIVSSLELLHIPSSGFNAAMNVIYPNLKTFITQYQFNNLSVDPLVHVFPKLQYVSCGHLSHSDVLLSELQTNTSHQSQHWRSLQAERERNLQNQEIRRWASLDTVRAGDIFALYGLAINCPVRHVQLGGFLNEGQLPLWRTVLQDCSASAATVQITTKSFNLEAPPFIIPPTGLITHLDLKVSIEKVLSQEDLLDNILQLVGSAPLTYLALTIEWCGYWGQSRWEEGSNILGRDYVFRFMQLGSYINNLKPLDVAQKVSRAIPSLRQFGCTTSVNEFNGIYDPQSHFESSNIGLNTYGWSTFITIERGDDGAILLEEQQGSLHKSLIRQARMVNLDYYHWAYNTGRSKFDNWAQSA